MYKLKPFKTFLLDSVRDDADSMVRVQRILKSLDIPMQDVEVFTPAQAADVVRRINAWSPSDQGGVPWQHRRALVFTKIRIEESERLAPLSMDVPDDVSEEGIRMVLGYMQLVQDQHSPDSDAARNVVCWNTRDFGVMFGCPHGCRYCKVGLGAKMICLGMNIDEYMQKVVGPTIEKYPGQKCFRLIGWLADITTFEPELGAFESFLKKLSEYEDRWGYFHTAGDNVDWIEKVPGRDRLIGVWSLTCDSGAQLIEPGAPSLANRLASVAKCQQWGIPVRLKFKPVVPLKNWKEQYAKAIEMIFKTTRPESLGFCVVMWMDLEQLLKQIPAEMLDTDFLAAATKAAFHLKGVHTGPFPHRYRAQIYRFLIQEARKHDKHIPLYISTESREMWEELSDQLGQNPGTFICGCNPIEAPGPRMMPSEALSTSTYVAKEK